MKICLVNAGIGSTTGGAETLVEQMALQLSKKHDVVVLTGKGERVAQLQEKFKVIAVPFSSRRSFLNKLQVKLQFPKPFGIEHLSPYEVESLSFFQGFKSGPQARQALQSSDVIGTFIYLDALLFSNYAAEKNIPAVFHSPGGVHGDFAKLDKSKIRLAVTRPIKNYLEKHQQVKIDGVLPMGMPTDWLKQRKETNKDKLLFVGRLYPGKGVGEAIQIFAGLKKKRHNLSLTIIGKGALEKELKAKIKAGEIADITFKGEKKYSKLNKYYAEAALLLLPSKAEGIATVILEALSCGLPVVSSDISNLKQFYRKGVVFLPKDDLDKWGKEIDRLLEDTKKLKALSLEGKHFAKEYSWDKIGKNYEKFLLEVLK